MNTDTSTSTASAQYIPEWARPDSPTRGMSEAELKAYYKAHSVEGDCRFRIERGSLDRSAYPDDILSGWAALRLDIHANGRRETPEHRRRRDALRKAWGRWIVGLPYTLPVVAELKPERKVKHCPHCGGEL